MALLNCFEDRVLRQSGLRQNQGYKTKPTKGSIARTIMES